MHPISEALPCTLRCISLWLCLVRTVLKEYKVKTSILHSIHLCSYIKIQPRLTNQKKSFGKYRLFFFSFVLLAWASATGTDLPVPCSDSGWPRLFTLKDPYRCIFCWPAAARCTPWTSGTLKEQLFAKKHKDRMGLCQVCRCCCPSLLGMTLPGETTGSDLPGWLPLLLTARKQKPHCLCLPQEKISDSRSGWTDRRGNWKK